ncbi:hypothetical protein [Hydrocarboniphaga sp.]|uniref:hypothetical protein n=1 Tax=Hydrocarboniphaga sp. TaxID=2033016 RepID=UPI003D0ED4E8
MNHPIKSLCAAGALSSLMLLTACGGGGSDSTNPSPTSTSIVGSKSLAGPLDPVQSQLTSTVIDPLSSSVSGTVLESVLACGNTIVNDDILDMVDTVLVSLQSSAANPGNADPAALTGSLRSTVIDLTQMLESLAGTTVDCAQDWLAIERLNNLIANLEKTPLKPLAVALQPVLSRIIDTIGANADAPPVQLATIAQLVAQLNTAFQSGMSKLPAGVYATPIVGGTLTTVSTSLGDISALLGAATTYSAAATGSAVQNLLDHTLTNLLTVVVPLQSLEGQSGQMGVVSSQITGAAHQLSALVGGTVGHVLTPVFNSQLLTALNPVLAPVENLLLPTILGPISDALANGTAQGSTGGALAGSVLAPVVNIVSGVLGKLTGSADTGTDAASCVFAKIPLLAVLCGKGG